MTTLELVKGFLNAFFVEQNSEKGLELLTDDIQCYGFNDLDEIIDINDLRKMAKSDLYHQFMACTLKIENEKQISVDCAILGYSLTLNSVTIRGHMAGNSRQISGENKLYFINNTMLNPVHFLQIYEESKRSNLKGDNSVVSIYATDVTDKKELESRFEDLIENIPSAICLYRWDGKHLHRLMTGSGFKELIGSSIEGFCDDPINVGEIFIHPDDFARFKKFLNEFLENEKEKTGSIQYRLWNEEKQAYIWVSAHGRLVNKNDGTSLLYVVYIDESEQVDLKNALTNTRNVINFAIKYGKFGLWTYDLSTGNIMQNLADGDSYGFDKDEIYSLDFFISSKVIYEEDVDAYKRCYQAIHDGAHNSDCIVRSFNKVCNEYRWIHIFLMTQSNENSKEKTAIGMSFDIDQEIKNYYDLSKSQELLKHEKQSVDDLFENLPAGVVMYKWNGKKLLPLYVSKGFSDFYGEDGKNLLEKTNGIDYAFVHPNDIQGLKDFILSNINKLDQFHVYRYRVWNKNLKDYIWIQLSGIVKLQADGTVIVYANYTNVDAEVKVTEEIRKEEELLEKTCHLAHIWMFYYDLKKKRIRLSKGLQQAYNLPAVIENYPDDFLKYKVIPKEYHQIYRQMVKKVESGEDATTEMPVIMADGTRVYSRFDWHVTETENGKIVEVAGLPFDITKEIAERRRFENERQKMLGADKKLSAYSITDLKKEIIIEAKDIYLGAGIKDRDTCKDFDKKVLTHILTEKDKMRYLEMRDPKYAIKMFEDGITEWTADMRWIYDNNQIIWRRSVYSVIENIYSNSLNLYSYLYDIMDEKMMNLLVSGIQENFYLFSGIISFVSKQIYSFNGTYSNQKLSIQDYDSVRKEYVEKNVLIDDREMVLDQNGLENVRKNLNDDKKNFSFVHRKMKDNELLYYQVRYSAVSETNDICIVVVRNVTDLVLESERKNAELKNALEAANAAAQTKTDFLSRMSHDMRTPLNAIMGLSALTLDDANNPVAVRENMTKMRASSDFLLGLLNDVLDMAKIEAGSVVLKREPYQYFEFLANMKTMFLAQCNAKNITLKFSELESNTVICTDKLRMNQIFFNVLSNAVKYTQPGGTIEFIAENLSFEKEILIVDFIIKDNGIGMTEEYQKHLFEPFMQENNVVTADLQGSGLGLSITKQLVDLLGGKISITSKKNVGTTVKLSFKLECLERNHKEVENAVPTSEIDYSILKEKKILLVEDHPLNAMIARKILEKKNVFVSHAENGRIAVDLFSASEENFFDAILMDIRMPEMSGLEATRAIRKLDRKDSKKIPIIALSANAYAEDVKKSLDSGMNYHLAKPINPTLLYQTLCRFLS